MQVVINQNCTCCVKCVKVCPGSVFHQEIPKSEITVAMPEMCIGCGHCVAVCPESAIQHSEFSENKVHPVDYGLYPTPEQMLLLIRARRSNRAMTNKEIPSEFINQITEAAYRAPTASNLQQVRVFLITDKDTLHKIGSFTISAFHSVVKLVDNWLGRFICKNFIPAAYKYLPVFRKMKSDFEQGNDLILRGAPALLLICTPKNSRFGCEDANLAYQNASLMAECLGVSQFYTGFVLSASKMKKGKLEKMLGIKGKIQAGMALGMPAFRYLKYVDRKNQ